VKALIEGLKAFKAISKSSKVVLSKPTDAQKLMMIGGGAMLYAATSKRGFTGKKKIQEGQKPKRSHTHNAMMGAAAMGGVITFRRIKGRIVPIRGK
jgi:hypothetical protein